MKFRTCGAIVCIAAILFVVWQVQLGSTRVLDPEGNGPNRDLLVAVAPSLEAFEIDVVLGASKDLPAPDPARPRVASLLGFIPAALDWGTFEQEDWERAFKRNAIGVLIALKPSGQAHIDKYDERCRTHVPPLNSEGCNFVSSWLSADPQQRVFLAFTSADAWQASKTRLALQRAGYIVFIFLDPNTNNAWAEPEMVGEIFAHASHRLVLDTINSRGSAGVKFEASCEEALMSHPARQPWTYAELLSPALPR
jgi:hypothetical protein